MRGRFAEEQTYFSRRSPIKYEDIFGVVVVGARNGRYPLAWEKQENNNIYIKNAAVGRAFPTIVSSRKGTNRGRRFVGRQKTPRHLGGFIVLNRLDFVYLRNTFLHQLQ